MYTSEVEGLGAAVSAVVCVARTIQELTLILYPVISVLDVTIPQSPGQNVRQLHQ